MRVKTPHTGSPRVPAPWQSAQGEAAPKVRPQRRSRWTSGSRFPPRCQTVEASRDRGTKGERPCGRPSKGVGFGRDLSARDEGNLVPSLLESTRKKSSTGRSGSDRTVNRHRWARRVASGERVKRGQGTRHNDPVTSEEGMPVLVLGFTLSARMGRSESAQATV